MRLACGEQEQLLFCGVSATLRLNETGKMVMGGWLFAAIIAVLAWLVDRNDFIWFCKATGRVIATPFLRVYHLLTQPVTWPVWEIVGLVAVVLEIIVVLIWLIVRAGSGKGVPFQASPFDYTTDEIFGVKWLWNFYFQRLNEDSLTALCPRALCRNRLRMQQDHHRMRMRQASIGGQMVVPVSFSCRNCGYSHEFDLSWGELQRDVLEEVERRINTGEFRQRMLKAQGGADGE